MTAWADITRSIRRIILMQEKIDRLAEGVTNLQSSMLDHEKRLVRIETMIEMAQSRNARARRRLESDDEG